MSCCGERYFFGCYSACDVVALPIVATYTGTMTVIWTFAGNQLTKTFQVEQDTPIILPNIFNENSIIDFQLEDANEDPVTYLDGETEWACFRFENNASIAAAAESVPVKDISDLKKLKAELQALAEEGFSVYLNNLVFVYEKNDFPAPSGGVITLLNGYTYVVTNQVDLTGDRIEAGGVCNLLGTSSETSSLTSTALGVGVPLLTSEYTIVIENITIKDIDTALSIDGNLRLVALDWENVNFENVANVGVINTCDNFIYDTGAFLGAQGLTFTGTIGTIGLNNSLFRGLGNAGSIVELDANCVVTRRFRVIYSSFIAFGSTVGIDVNAAATLSPETYILDTINFSGGSTYLTGVTDISNKALFINCLGITNTAVNGQMYMQDNATATVISNTVDFFKIAGVTTASAENSKYTMTDNRLTNNAVIERKYLLTCTLSFTSGANNICQFGFYDSILAGIREPSKTKATGNTGGRAENVTLTCVVNHSSGDFIEVHARNTSGANNITVTDMNVVIIEIK